MLFLASDPLKMVHEVPAVLFEKNKKGESGKFIQGCALSSPVAAFANFNECQEAPEDMIAVVRVLGRSETM